MLCVISAGMRRRFGFCRLGIVSCFLLVMAHLVLAQEVERISYQEALQTTLLQNTNVKRAENNKDYREAVVRREYMDFLPSLDISNRGTRTFGRSFSQEEGTILSETSDFYALEVNANLDLFHGFEGVASLAQARQEHQASRLMALRERQSAVFDVVDHFATFLQNGELAQGRAQELKAQDDLLVQVEGLVRVGRRPTSDLYQQQAAQAEAEADLLVAQRDVAVSEMGLIQLLHLDPLGHYEFDATTFPNLAQVLTDSVIYEGILHEALEKRLDVQALARTVEARKQEVKVARAGFWPRLSLRYSYGSDWSSTARQSVIGTGAPAREITITPDDGSTPATFRVPGSSVDPDFFQPTFGNQLKDRRGGSIQLALNIPLFDRFETLTNVKAAQVDLVAAEYDWQDLQNRVALEVRRALLDYRSAIAQWRASEKRLQAATRARDAAQRRYELGAASFVELAQAISGYAGAKSAEVRARYATVRARELIRYQTGHLDIPERKRP